MNKYNDYELLMLYNEKNEEAEKILFEEYDIVIKYIIKKYKSILLSKGIDLRDVYNELLSTFNISLTTFDASKEATFNTYTKLLLERKIRKILNKKEIPTNEEENMEEYPEQNSNPLALLCQEENSININRYLVTELSSKELNVVVLLAKGYNYKEVANILNKKYHIVYKIIRDIRKKILTKDLNCPV